MTRKEIEEKLKEIVVERLGVDKDKIVEGAKFVEDLGADSLDIVELIMGIEEMFEVEIPDEEAEKLTSVGDALNYVLSKVEVEG